MGAELAEYLGLFCEPGHHARCPLQGSFPLGMPSPAYPGLSLCWWDCQGGIRKMDQWNADRKWWILSVKNQTFWSGIQTIFNHAGYSCILRWRSRISAVLWFYAGRRRHHTLSGSVHRSHPHVFCTDDRCRHEAGLAGGITGGLSPAVWPAFRYTANDTWSWSTCGFQKRQCFGCLAGVDYQHAAAGGRVASYKEVHMFGKSAESKNSSRTSR